MQFVQLKDYEIKVEDFKKLSKAERIRVYLKNYGEAGIQMISENEVIVNGNKMDVVLEDAEKKEKATKVPHHAVEKLWDEKVDKLLDVCQKMLDKIEEYKKIDLAHVTSNLFVPKELSKYVFANLEQTAQEIHGLKLEIEKTKHAYKSIQ